MDQEDCNTTTVLPAAQEAGKEKVRVQLMS